MFSNLRSLIFKLDPEVAHSLAIKSLKLNFIPNILNTSKDNDLFKTKLFNKDIANPIGVAAGFDKNAEVYNSLFKLGFGFVEVGTITPLKQYGNPKPNLNKGLYTSAFLSKPAAIPMGLSKSWLNNFVFKMGSFLFSSNIFETKLSLRDWIAKKCALSGSILNIKDLKFEYIISIY